jgi:hypothetical protein
MSENICRLIRDSLFSRATCQQHGPVTDKYEDT